MALSIASTAVFSTSNMKPEPGEQGDALWAQKVADNTGFVYYKTYHTHVPSVSGAAPSYTFLFTKLPGQSAINLKVRGDNTAAAAVSDLVKIYADGVDYVAGSPGLSYTHSYTRGQNTTNVYSIDITSLTDNADYAMKVTLDTGGHGALAPSCYIT
jgi:hypothetical protein